MGRLKRLGVLGGTFDPPHIGHLVLAAEALDQLKLDRLLWVLTPDPPHKRHRQITPVEIRLELVRAALAGNPVLELSRVDLDRPSPHYAADTVRLLGQAYPGWALFYLMGGDSLRDLPLWHAPQAFLDGCHGLGVMRRPGVPADLSDIEARLPGVTARVHWIEAPLVEISSSDIRQRIAQGRPYRYFLPAPVFRLVQKYHLYHLPELLS